jgi:hypothetical protein
MGLPARDARYAHERKRGPWPNPTLAFPVFAVHSRALPMYGIHALGQLRAYDC